MRLTTRAAGMGNLRNRNVLGLLDYRPVGYTNRRNKRRYNLQILLRSDTACCTEVEVNQSAVDLQVQSQRKNIKLHLSTRAIGCLFPPWAGALAVSLVSGWMRVMPTFLDLLLRTMRLHCWYSLP